MWGGRVRDLLGVLCEHRAGGESPLSSTVKAYLLILKRLELFMQTRNKLLRVYDTLGLDLVNVSLKHGLEGGTQSFFWELKLGQNLLHFMNSDASTALCISLLQRVVQLHFLHEHFGHIHFIEEIPVLNRPLLLRVKLILDQLELSW